MERRSGTVIWFNAKKGYGFLTCEQEPGTEYFVHYSNVHMDGFKQLVSGQRVSYNIGSNHRGVQAIEVEVVGEPEQTE